MAETRTVYVVCKHVLAPKTGEELRQEDYLDEFSTAEAAGQFRLQKEMKYLRSVEDELDDLGTFASLQDLENRRQELEGRRFEVVSKVVPA